MNHNFDLSEIRIKEKRAKDYLDKSGRDAVVIGRQDNFSWYTCGGTSKVVIPTELGTVYLVITKQKVYVVAYEMDGQRIMDEEIPGYDAEPVIISWCDGSLEDKVLQLTKGMKAVSDIPIPGIEFAPGEIYGLHYPLTDKEIERCRLIGEATEKVFCKVADQLKPGMTDYEVEAMFLYEYALMDAIPEVVLVGIDERIKNYRHCIPSGKKIGKMLVLHTALRMRGLHANIARMVHFGDDIPEDTLKRYETANTILATAMSMCTPGRKFTDIHSKIKSLFYESGYEEEWKKHFVGGITGYLLADTSVCFDPNAEVCINQPYDWFITITGVKVEELVMNSSKGVEAVSVTGKWPVKEYQVGDFTVKLPQILIK